MESTATLVILNLMYISIYISVDVWWDLHIRSHKYTKAELLYSQITTLPSHKPFSYLQITEVKLFSWGWAWVSHLASGSSFLRICWNGFSCKPYFDTWITYSKSEQLISHLKNSDTNSFSIIASGWCEIHTGIQTTLHYSIITLFICFHHVLPVCLEFMQYMIKQKLIFHLQQKLPSGPFSVKYATLVWPVTVLPHWVNQHHFE